MAKLEAVSVTDATAGSLRVADFFAGIGLVRLGLEDAGFKVMWANDIEADKQKMYAKQFGHKGMHFALRDIGKVEACDLPTKPFARLGLLPMYGLVSGGWRAGLIGKSLATFWHFTRLMRESCTVGDQLGSRPSGASVTGHWAAPVLIQAT
jgi:DNA (cytosine-5)-methyltransferase 1